MYRKCATERSPPKQRTSENAFFTLMEKLPYEQIMITQICEEAGISRGVFYHSEIAAAPDDVVYPGKTQIQKRI